MVKEGDVVGGLRLLARLTEDGRGKGFLGYTRKRVPSSWENFIRVEIFCRYREKTVNNALFNIGLHFITVTKKKTK